MGWDVGGSVDVEATFIPIQRGFEEEDGSFRGRKLGR